MECMNVLIMSVGEWRGLGDTEKNKYVRNRKRIE